MTYVKLGAVRVFPNLKPDKAQAMKVLEEAAEVFGAWQKWDHACKNVINPAEAAPFIRDGFKRDLLAEIADTIQACANLSAALGGHRPHAVHGRVRGAEQEEGAVRVKVNINDITDRERIVMTKAQMVAYLESCELRINRLANGFSGQLATPDIIEVEEVLGEWAA